MNIYDIGTAVTVSVRFLDTAGRPTDPGAVYCTVRGPDGPPTHYLYGRDSALIRTGVGAYALIVVGNSDGDWLYRWAATGAGATAADGRFSVTRSELYPP